jgi:hypothetical protein
MPGWALVAAGGASLVAGTILLALAEERRASVVAACPAKQCSDAGALGTASEGQAFFVGGMSALAAGAAATGLGAYLLWPRTGEPAAHAVGAAASWAVAF